MDSHHGITEDPSHSSQPEMEYPDTWELRQPGMERLVTGAPIISKKAQRALERKRANAETDKK